MGWRRRILAGAAVVSLALVAFGLWRWFPTAREPDYRLLLAWGELGSGPGRFHQPMGLAIAGDEVFVSDAGNDRIQVFDRNGLFLRQFGHPGDGWGQLARPMLMDVRGGRLHVAEYLNDRVQVFGLDGTSLAIVGSSGSGPGRFDAPGGVAVDANGRMYVADFFHHRVQLLDPAGQFIRQYGTGRKGIRAGRLNYPTDVALLPSGDVIVADAYNDRVQVFDSAGGFRRKWGGPFALDIPGGAPGWFKTATGVAVGLDGNVFVADFYNHRIQKFTPDGRFLVAIGSRGTAPGRFVHPTDMAVDDQGHLYVVDFGNDRIQKFAPRSRSVSRDGREPPELAQGLARGTAVISAITLGLLPILWGSGTGASVRSSSSRPSGRSGASGNFGADRSRKGSRRRGATRRRRFREGLCGGEIAASAVRSDA